MNIVLVHPQIPQNTGNIARTCAATGSTLHLVHPLGFSTDEKRLKRAGLDYWNLLEIYNYNCLENFLNSLKPGDQLYFFTTKARKNYCDMKYSLNSYLIFGSETKGLPEELLVKYSNKACRIPMIKESRSLNLSNSVAIAVYEALRQTNFSGLQQKGDLHRLKW